jgi:hydroxypyruvate isomerase
MAAIVTLATGANAVKDIRFLLWSLEYVYKEDCPDLYIYTDTDTSRLIPSYKGNCFLKIALDGYTGFNRQQMEGMKGFRFKTKWTDFMCEKISALEWAFEHTQTEKGL